MTAPAPRRERAFIPLGRRRPVVVDESAAGYTSNPFTGVDWSLAYAAFVAYACAIVTFRIPVGTEAMVVALLALPMERRALKMPRLSLMTFALLGWALVGESSTNYPIEVIAAVGEFAKVCAVVFVAVNVLTSRPRMRLYLVFTTILFILFPVRGALINYIGGNTVQGRAVWNYIYGNPNDLAGLALLQLSVALGALKVERKWWVRNGLMLAVALLVVVIALTQSRGVMIALVMFSLLMGWRSFRKITPRRVGGVVVLFLLVYITAPESMWRRFSTIANATDDSAELMDFELTDAQSARDQSSSVQRLAIWRVARTIIAENAVTGVGLGAYGLVHSEVAQRAGMPSIARGRRDTHSTYLKIGAELGVVGLLIFVILLASTIVSALRTVRAFQARSPLLADQLYNMLIGLCAFLVAAIWGSYGMLVATYMQMVVIACCAKLLQDGENGAQAPRRRGGLAIARANMRPPVGATP